MFAKALALNVLDADEDRMSEDSAGFNSAGPNAAGTLLAPAARALAISLAALICEGVIAPDTLFARGMKHIVANPREASTSVETAAVSLEVSTRTVEAAFTAEGTAFSAELRAMRVQTAHELHLNTPDLSPADVARAAGFSSLSAVYRAVRAEEQRRP